MRILQKRFEGHDEGQSFHTLQDAGLGRLLLILVLRILLDFRRLRGWSLWMFKVERDLDRPYPLEPQRLSLRNRSQGCEPLLPIKEEFVRPECAR